MDETGEIAEMEYIFISRLKFVGVHKEKVNAIFRFNQN
jgi:hypothetical protein